ncbi:hypothetical protein YC2023_090208 [Brassica napus]
MFQVRSTCCAKLSHNYPGHPTRIWAHALGCESALHSEVETLRWTMENMLQHSPCQSFGIDCKELIAMIKEPHE